MQPARTTDDTAAGFTCPRCGARMRVHTTRQAGPNVTIRFRKCGTCSGSSVKTEERILGATTRNHRP